jgi:ubiquitin fusion degradation protein 1
MMPGHQRDNVSFGGKIIMPPSALANLTNLDLEGPWTFQLRNPSNPAASTHAGVLEFIAQEGCVNLPYWMMKTLRLQEGDPIRITGARLPKGKFVKIQAQSVHFLELSDPKAVLEQALRNFSGLTQGDIIEIIYNKLVFEILIMEIKPDGAGISLLDTDLEVDFAPPKGYVEPVRPDRPAAPTMAEKLKIDVNSSTPGSSRPGSAMGTNVITNDGGDFEAFKGAGQTLNGRKTKGKGKSARKVEEVDPASKIIRTDKQRLITVDALEDRRVVPAPLNLPFGKLFFGYQVIPYKAPEEKLDESMAAAQSFAGSGNSLSGNSAHAATASSSTPAAASQKSSSKKEFTGHGRTLGGRRSDPPDVIVVDSD